MKTFKIGLVLLSGVTSKLEAVSNPRKILGLNLMVDSIVVCAWGEDGAAARDKNGSVYVRSFAFLFNIPRRCSQINFCLSFFSRPHNNFH
jgi:hypothetical protein